MNQGTLSEHYLTNSVIKNIHKTDKTAILPHIGEDYSVSGDIISADGTGEAPYIAWIKAVNNFACSGGAILGARIAAILPTNVKDSVIKKYMQEFDSLSEKDGIQIVGGNTEVVSYVSFPRFIVTVFGKSAGYKSDKSGINSDSDIVMAGYAGALGTNLLISKCEEELAQRFTKPFIESAKIDIDNLSVKRAADALFNSPDFESFCVKHLHDVSCGGIYTALWQLGKWSDKGFLIDNKKINIKQETIELCSQLDINPYLLDGTGALLIVCNNSKDIINLMHKKGITASIIGRITDGKERLVKLSDSDIRTLSPSDTDAVFMINK